MRVCIAASFLVWFQSFALPMSIAFALEESADQLTNYTSDDSVSPENPSQSPSAVTLETGDATATANTDLTLQNQIEIPGNPPPNCTMTSTCLGDTSVNVENQTTTATDTTADSDSGVNVQNVTQTEVEISTGDATAIAKSDNQINTNNIDLSPPEVSTASAAFIATQSGQLEDSKTDIALENKANISDNTQADANTGADQQQTGSGDQSLATGDAIAIANSVNLINSNTVGSDVYFLVVDIIGGENQINLYDVWDKISQGDLTYDDQGNLLIGSLARMRLFELLADNQASVSAQVTANATTGQNQQTSTSGDQLTTTGNAYAVANAVSWINTTITGSQILAGVINIFGNYAGDIIIPSVEYINQMGLHDLKQSYQANLTINNQSNLANNAIANANTGQNTQSSRANNQQLQTGQAVAQANAVAYVNTTLFANFFYQLILNNFGNWSGEMIGLDRPDQQITAPQGTSSITPFELPNPGNIPENQSNQQSNITITNLATLANTAVASASTGSNHQQSNSGDQTLHTGDAIAIANAIAFMNTSIIGSHGFLAVINVLGDWLGNLIFAHPDLVITNVSPQTQVSPGEEVVYTVTVTNQGYAKASGVEVHNDFPDDLIHLSDSITPSLSSGSNRTWQLGTLATGESISFQVYTKVDPNLNPTTSEITYSLSVTGDKEEVTDNNQASETDRVVFVNRSIGGPNQDDQVLHAEPALTIQSSTNCNDFIYAGDSVILYLTIKNDSNGEARDGRVTAMLHNPNGDIVSGIQWDAGLIKPHEVINLTFIVPISKTSPSGNYFFASWIDAKDVLGDVHSSNQSLTQFSVVAKTAANGRQNLAPNPIIPQAEAANGRILGSVSHQEDPLQKILLYLLAVTMSAWLGLKYMKSKDFWLEASQ